ncbi:hypothetical protein IDJ75_11155 [Mucilaginibacter rigui]|uniref:Uncharacterized protein n=1 Tax=Mucilaginibacter rigui TaxID=534635 RepID=A0ABR7X5H3_9SPHI|nr:hypothetical protein [Mucilaginibacter rigui]MBD1385838.1 hypothetical protein [Mucilaginibacter rigui]
MRSKLFKEQPKTAQISTERWVRILPDTGEGYRLFDAMQERYIGRILFDADDNWIYDGTVLNVYEQEEIAGSIAGHQKEMDQLIQDL